jgi:hypothetical protein
MVEVWNATGFNVVDGTRVHRAALRIELLRRVVCILGIGGKSSVV